MNKLDCEKMTDDRYIFKNYLNKDINPALIVWKIGSRWNWFLM